MTRKPLGVRMYSQDHPGRTVYKVGTPRVGVDGLAEALRAKYGTKEARP